MNRKDEQPAKDPGSMTLREIAAELVMRDLPRMTMSGRKDGSSAPDWIAVMATGEEARAIADFLIQRDALAAAAAFGRAALQGEAL